MRAERGVMTVIKWVVCLHTVGLTRQFFQSRYPTKQTGTSLQRVHLRAVFPRRDNQSVGFIINPLLDYKSLVFLNSTTSCIPFIICKTSSYRLTNQTVWGLFETVRPRQCFYFRLYLRFFERRFLFSSSWRHSSWIGKLLPRVLLKREHSVATLFGKTGKIQRNKSTNSSAASSAGSVLTDSDTEGLIALHLYYRGCRLLLFFTLWMSGVIWLQGNDFGWRIWSNYYSEKKHCSCKWGRNVSRKSLIYHSVLLQWCNNPSS